jgi:ABC-type transport system involved in multi-copper enzyme maturation permease subunit
MKLARALASLWWLSFCRLLWSSNTLMVALPLALGVLFVWRRDYAGIIPLSSSLEQFSEEFVLVIFAAFLVPVICLAYATTSIGGDREDRTLMFLLVRPVPRPLIFLVKLLATLPLALALSLGSFYVAGRMAGAAGNMAFQIYWPPISYMTIAYVSLFHLFAVAFRHATILALIYSLFIEFFIGNMPGIVKRTTINYYGRSMIYELGAPAGLRAPDPEWYVPLASDAARDTLIWITLGAILVAVVIFQRREYRDLT